MVDWGGSSLQIVIAIIGSGLIVTGVTSLASFINNPLLNIDVKTIDKPHDNGTISYIEDEPGKWAVVTFPHGDTYTTYRINLTNIGNSPAKDVRLTLTYPGAKVVDSKPVYESENITFTNQTSNSVVALLPRLSPGILVAVDNNITGNIETIGDNYTDYSFPTGNDFGSNSANWVYTHKEPFTIVATYDGGAKIYRPSEYSAFGHFINIYFNPEILKFYYPIVVAVLLFVIAFRRKRKSMSGSASDILKHIEAVEGHLKNNDSRTIFSFSKDDPQEHNLRIFENYDEYDLIDDFYKGLNQRDLEISRAYLSNDAHYIDPVLEEQNKKCFSLATAAHSKIDWKKFYKFDLILLMPAIVLGASFISLICEGVPLMIFVQYTQYVPDIQYGDIEFLIGLFFITAFVARSIGTYFILKWILLRTQGSSISNYVIPRLSRPIKFFAYCSLIMGIPT